MRMGKIWAGLGLIGILFGGCEAPPSVAPVAGGNDIHGGLLTVNGLAYTLSLIHVASDLVTVNFATTGTIPNEIHVQNRKIYVVNSGSNNIQVFNADNFSNSSSLIDVGVGCNPWSLIIQDDSTGYCSCLQTNEVLKVNLAGLSVTTRKTIPSSLGKFPEGLALANGKLYTAMTAATGCGTSYSCGDGTNVAVLDLSDFAGNSFTSVAVDTVNPQALAVDVSNRVHVVCTGDYFSSWGKVNVIDSSTDTVTGSVTGFTNYSPGLIHIASNGKGFVAGWPGAFAYDAAALGAVTIIDSDPSHGYLGVSSTNGFAYFSDFPNDKVRAFNVSSYAAGPVYDVGDGPGSSVYVP